MNDKTRHTRNPKPSSTASNIYNARYDRYKQRIENRLTSIVRTTRPVCVYDPVRYVLQGGGKRIRALLTLLSAEAVGGKAASALNAACAIEVLHNFTLVHDDVMDHSSLRRGRPTVHTKWDMNIAILAGDELMGYAYKALLLTRSPHLRELVDSFTDALVQVCEGQGFDMEFETRDDVTLDEYLVMIRKKTAKVISSACELGALTGNGAQREVNALRQFGDALGMAFQIQDDLLDITGTEKILGKPIGGDILEGKKTYVLLQALARAKGADRKLLLAVVRKQPLQSGSIQAVKAIYERTGVLNDARRQVAFYTKRAQQALTRLPESPARSMLAWLSELLLERHS